jgi:uncharacterized protein (TIGR02594 family)
MWTAMRLWLAALFGRRLVIPAADPPSLNSRSSTPSRAPSTEPDDDDQDEKEAASTRGDPPWLALARKEDGTREIPGARHNPRVLEYFRDAGHPEISDDETAWCAAFVGSMLKRSGYMGTGSLMARSYAKWGVACEPKIGCVVVTTRGRDDGVFGHVGFYVGEDHSHVFLLGGNQSNAVNVKKFPKKIVLAYRWPKTVTNSRTMKAAGTTGGGTVMKLTSEALPTDGGAPTGEMANQVREAGQQLQGLAEVKWWLGVIGTVLILVGIAWTIYARWDDMKNKGR